MFRPTAHRSFGYVESTVSVTILTGAVFAGLQMMGSYVSGVEIGAETQIARQLAAELMAEILAQPFEDESVSGAIGPESGESTRTAFDDCDDYDGMSEPIMTGPDGTALDIAAERRLGVRVYVEWVRPDTLLTLPASPERNAKRVRIIIMNRDLKIRYRLIGYRMNTDGGDGS